MRTPEEIKEQLDKRLIMRQNIQEQKPPNWQLWVANLTIQIDTLEWTLGSTKVQLETQNVRITQPANRHDMKNANKHFG